MNEQLDASMAAARRPISRRAVGLGAAWSVPLILTAVAAPAAAASNTAPPPVIGVQRTADKVASAKRVDFTLTFSNPGGSPVTVDVLSISSTGGGAPAPGGIPTSVIVPNGGTASVSFSWNYGNNAATATYTITYRVSGVIHTVLPLVTI
jgi:hypothetical protein